MLSSVEVLDPVANTWLTDTDLPSIRRDLGAATGNDGNVYAVGGASGAGSYLGTVAVYAPGASPATGTWSSSPYSLSVPRSSLAVTADRQGRIWAIGGRTAAGVSGAVEVFDPSQAALGWVTKAPLPTARADLAASTGPDGIIYASGGISNNGIALRTVEAYDPVANTWSTKALLPGARTGLAGALQADGRIMAAGGRTTSPGTGSVMKHTFYYETPVFPTMSVAPVLIVGTVIALYTF